VWFGGRLVQKGGTSVAAPDRLGSIGRYLPYGEERTGQSGNPANGNEKFATYTRDGVTGLDYADQRWYAQGQGRFLTADTSLLNEAFDAPASWNQYSYVEGDPIGFIDPSGLAKCGDLNVYLDGNPANSFGTVRSLILGTGERSLLAQIMWHEAGNVRGSNFDGLVIDQVLIGTAIMNQRDASTGVLNGYGIDGNQHYYPYGTDLTSIILRAGGNNQDWGMFAGGSLRPDFVSSLEWALSLDVGTGSLREIEAKPECYAVLSAVGQAILVYNIGKRLYFAEGYQLHWNSSGANDASTTAAQRDLNPYLANLGRSGLSRTWFFGMYWWKPQNPVPLPPVPLPKRPQPPRPRPVPM
jgi:RHS repeat-associated protein